MFRYERFMKHQFSVRVSNGLLKCDTLKKCKSHLIIARIILHQLSTNLLLVNIRENLKNAEKVQSASWKIIMEGLRNEHHSKLLLLLCIKVLCIFGELESQKLEIFTLPQLMVPSFSSGLNMVLVPYF